eukprot:TRINITY_DN3656_c1_g5_i2.p1 TRINITY_DN3656_c1_g5~~TRINITY_DN3656_c1_g5_i2.p1  ORF type:complete len:633 (+),score=96.20 TRINITY_DN3656_c1_g5_i2:39-1937(+)
MLCGCWSRSAADTDGLVGADTDLGPACNRRLSLPYGEAKRKWQSDVARIDEGVRLLFCNDFRSAETTFLEGFQAPEPGKGAHDLRAEFAFNWALAALIRGIATLQNDQFDECLRRVHIAVDAAEHACDASWIGHQIILGCCRAIEGVICLIQRNFMRGVICLSRSWSFLRKAERHCALGPRAQSSVDINGQELVVRSVSLFICGAVGLIASLLPSSIGGLAKWLVGVPVDRDLAINRLERCWIEKGLLAPWACAVALAFHVDVRFFLGEEIGQTELKLCHDMLDWALARHPGSIVFGLLQANLLALESKNDLAIHCIGKCADHISEVPALGLVVHAQYAKLALVAHRWSDAALAFDRAASVNVEVGRRTMVPSLIFAAALCSIQAGDASSARKRLLQVQEYTLQNKKNWPPSDKRSMAIAGMYLGEIPGGALPWSREDLRACLVPLLDLLELLELKLHALRRTSPERLAWLLSQLEDANLDGMEASDEFRVACEARRLRYCAELARLLGRDDVLRRVAVVEELLSSKVVCGKDGTAALVQYTKAEISFAKGDLAGAQRSCRAMQRHSLSADFWINLMFKAHNLEQRITHNRRYDAVKLGSPLRAVDAFRRAIAVVCLCCRRRAREAGGAGKT